MDLGGAHGGLERGEAVIEGAEDGDHGVRVPLALPQRVPQHRRPPRQRVHLLRQRRHRHASSPRAADRARALSSREEAAPGEISTREGECAGEQGGRLGRWVGYLVSNLLEGRDREWEGVIRRWRWSAGDDAWGCRRVGMKGRRERAEGKNCSNYRLRDSCGRDDR